MANFRTLDQADVKGKRVLLRVDLNVPTENGQVTDATRIERVAPTITEIADKGGKVILLAHFGRPKGPDPKESLKPIAAAVSRRRSSGTVGFAEDCIGEKAEAAVAAMKPGDILLLENTRFHKGEEKNDPAFVAALAKLGDLWVNDAFSAAHRAHASTEGLGHKLPAYAGRTMQAELEALAKALDAPKKPVIAIVGGAKVSTKLELLENLDRQGRGAGDRRRHGQHLPACPGHQGRQIAGREGHGGHRPPHPGQGREPAAAPSSCRSTPSSRSTSRPMRPPTPMASMRSRLRA